ncbi:MAG: hypothetical protein K2P26_02840 [Oscillospiraceae bacterium]|nr:hypothetical protein [Oscillospiraceae bacterium]
MIKWAEDTLIRDGTFFLPGRKAPLKNETEDEAILVDAAESPIERPKKAKAAHTKKHSCSSAFRPEKSLRWHFPTARSMISSYSRILVSMSRQKQCWILLDWRGGGY